MTAISRSMVRIAILAADVNASAVASTDYIEGEITNYSKSGGDSDVESVAAFGGFIDKEKPVSQEELSFEFVPKILLDRCALESVTIHFNNQLSNTVMFRNRLNLFSVFGNVLLLESNILLRIIHTRIVMQ